MIRRRVSLISVILGSVSEWYDFALYGFLSPVIAKVFFPFDSLSKSLLFTFLIFAIGFLARPIGAVFFGHVGDRVGRKKALLLSIILMSFSTAFMGLLPDYKTIGFFAPILLLLLRLLQGLAVSGEVSGTSTYLIEMAKPNRRAFLSSFVMWSIYLGLLLGAVVGFLATHFCSKAMLYNWGWRLPFLASLLFGLILFLMRLFSHETEAFNEVNENDNQHAIPIVEAIKSHGAKLVAIIGMVCVAAVAGYLLIGFFPAFFVVYHHFALSTSLLIQICTILFILMILPFLGYLGDRLGYLNLMMIGNIGFLCLTFPLFWLFMHASLIGIILAMLLYAVCLICINAVIVVVMGMLFPAEVRYSGLGLAFNVALALFGGTAPMISQFLLHHFRSPFAVATYLFVCALISLPFMIWIKSYSRKKATFM